MAASVPAIISELKILRARITALDDQIQNLQALAAQLDGDLIAYPTSHIEFLPHKEGQHSDPVADRVANGASPETIELYNDIRRLIVQRGKTASSVALAESALAVLTKKERFVVQLRAIDDLPWQKISDIYYEKTNHDISEKTLRNWYAESIDKLNLFLGT